jgi:hypothetical protein
MRKITSTSGGKALKLSTDSAILRGFIAYHQEDLRKLKTLSTMAGTSVEIRDLISEIGGLFGHLGGQWLIAPNEHAHSQVPLDLLLKGSLGEVRDALICEIGGHSMAVD